MCQQCQQCQRCQRCQQQLPQPREALGCSRSPGAAGIPAAHSSQHGKVCAGLPPARGMGPFWSTGTAMLHGAMSPRRCQVGLVAASMSPSLSAALCPRGSLGAPAVQYLLRLSVRPNEIFSLQRQQHSLQGAGLVLNKAFGSGCALVLGASWLCCGAGLWDAPAGQRGWDAGSRAGCAGRGAEAIPARCCRVREASTILCPCQAAGAPRSARCRVERVPI